MGIRIALDDFGTGRSTLTTLHELPVDQLKLDRSCTRNTAGRRATMPAAVLAPARAVGLDIVAEGIETEEQASHLTALGYRWLSLRQCGVRTTCRRAARACRA
jgi:diguanylate cyclase